VYLTPLRLAEVDMAHYAMLDENNVVTQVIVGRNEYDMLNGMLVDWEAYYGGKRTSYNTRGGVHLLGYTPLRKNFAGIGYTYDATRDAFIPPQPYPSWTLNEDTCLWECPVPFPTDGQRYNWDEGTTNWVVIKEDGK
jgi:hypothetical protein